MTTKSTQHAGTHHELPASVARLQPLLRENTSVSDATRRLPDEVIDDLTDVVSAMIPWNFPQTLSAFKYVPALAAGNTVVLKPSPETPLDALLLQNIKSISFPNNTFPAAGRA
jgi:acyl-CoA reductase-like NAD-dependent aldehyde dehydrogenase